jgi:hypothetical protein
MKRGNLVITITILLSGVLTMNSCRIAISGSDLRATHVVPAVAATLTSVAATQTAQVTPTATPSPKVALVAFHGRYVTSMGEDDDWSLRQKPELGDCGWFTQHHLANGKIALETCHGRYITAPRTGTERQDWMLGQESGLGPCGQFDLYELGSDRVAFKTCAKKFFTAGDGNWPPPLQWSVVAETDILLDWEIFTVLQQ